MGKGTGKHTFADVGRAIEQQSLGQRSFKSFKEFRLLNNLYDGFQSCLDFLVSDDIFETDGRTECFGMVVFGMTGHCMLSLYQSLIVQL